MRNGRQALVGCLGTDLSPASSLARKTGLSFLRPTDRPSGSDRLSPSDSDEQAADHSIFEIAVGAGAGASATR